MHYGYCLMGEQCSVFVLCHRCIKDMSRHLRIIARLFDKHEQCDDEDISTDNWKHWMELTTNSSMRTLQHIRQRSNLTTKCARVLLCEINWDNCVVGVRARLFSGCQFVHNYALLSVSSPKCPPRMFHIVTRLPTRCDNNTFRYVVCINLNGTCHSNSNRKPRVVWHRKLRSPLRASFCRRSQTLICLSFNRSLCVCAFFLSRNSA